jgi:hypothetical protein
MSEQPKIWTQDQFIQALSRQQECFRQHSLVQLAALNEALIDFKGKCIGLIREWETTANYRLNNANMPDHGGCNSADEARAQAAVFSGCAKSLRVIISYGLDLEVTTL